MSQLTFRVSYAQSFRAGQHCPTPPTVTLEVDPAELSPEQRQLIAGRLNDAGQVCGRDREGKFFDGRYTLQSPAVRNSEARGEVRLLTAGGPTLEDLLAAIRREDAAIDAVAQARAAARAAEEAERREETLAVLRERRTAARERAYRADGAVAHWSSEVYARAEVVAPDWPVHRDEEVAASEEAQAWLAELQAADDQRRDAAIAAETERRAAEARDRAAWIAAHGSPHLRRLAAEGIAHDLTYHEERDAWETAQFARLLDEHRPGWAAIDPEDLDEEVAEVSERAIALLDAGRQAAPDCRLAKLRASGRYVVIEDYQGRLIYWPQD